MPTRRRTAGRRLAIALVLWSAAALGLAGGALAPSAAGLSRWTGGIDLYRPGVFSTQQTWLWCTAADVQIIRNIVRHGADHSRASQGRYFDYMRAHDRYRIPLKDGVDPAGWTAGLRHYVDGRYRLVASTSFAAALRSAVTNLRRTNLPVGITVSHGNHAWVLTGFTATADPAVTSRFTVTSVRVTGPLWGLQSTSYGYDMKPDTRLTPRQLAGFFTPWHYTSVPMAWENRWVSVQPIPAAPAPKPAPATPKPTPVPSPSASAVAAASIPPASPAQIGAVLPVVSASPAATATDVADPVSAAGPAPPLGVLAFVVGSLVVAAVAARGFVRGRRT